MGYYIRVLSTSPECVPLSLMRRMLARSGFAAVLEADDGVKEEWEQIDLSHAGGHRIASIGRNLVEEGSLGAAEIEEFVEAIADCQPTSAVAWLLEYFPRVRCVYAFQLLSGTDKPNGWEILGVVKDSVWSYAPAIVQADIEGFSDEEGYHILWQFSDSVKGDWAMGVLQDGEWVHFRMDLGNREHREAFRRGEIPNGVELE